MNKKSLPRGWYLSVLIAIVFVVLKLTGIIAWSWIWVLSPIWIPIFGIGLSILFLVSTRKHRRKFGM